MLCSGMKDYNDLGYKTTIIDREEPSKSTMLTDHDGRFPVLPRNPVGPLFRSLTGASELLRHAGAYIQQWRAGDIDRY